MIGCMYKHTYILYIYIYIYIHIYIHTYIHAYMLVGCEGEVVARRSIILRLAGRARSGAMARICFWKILHSHLSLGSVLLERILIILRESVVRCDGADL